MATNDFGGLLKRWLVVSLSDGVTTLKLDVASMLDGASMGNQLCGPARPDVLERHLAATTKDARSGHADEATNLGRCRDDRFCHVSAVTVR